MDIDETNLAASVANIVNTFNDENKYFEMDCYTISKIYADWTALGNTVDGTVPSTTNVLTLFDSYMSAMDENNVPEEGRILYVIPAVRDMIKNATNVTRYLSVGQDVPSEVNRIISRLDTVTIRVVPSTQMKSLYVFTTGAVPDATAKQIKMLLVHPLAVITPLKYNFVNLAAPSAVTQGKYKYYEEAYEDVFVLKNKASAVMINAA